MNMITKIFNLLATAFMWIVGRSREYKERKRENERYHREAIDELRRSNDELVIRIAELYKEVIASRHEIAKLQAENLQLSGQVKLLTEQNAVLIAEFENKKKRRKAIKQ